MVKQARGLYQNIFDNPILMRELRRRMRGRALIYSIIGYIVLMSAVSIILLVVRLNPFAVASSRPDSQELLQLMTSTGLSLFIAITAIQALLVLIIAPTITAGMTTGEKERKTFEFLRVTTISPWMYTLGSFLSTVFYVGLALLCALPLLSLALLYGGIGFPDIVLSLATLLGASMILSAFGLYISSVRERTRTAQGIVVFVIFSAIFGGIIVREQLTMWLGATAAAGGQAAQQAATLTTTTIAGFPMWFLWGFGIFAVTGIFLLISARKLFEPVETRAFSHWQFAVIAGGLMAGALFLIENAGGVTNRSALAFLTLGCVLLIVAAVTFGAGRMEVGDEIWHLKRLLPFLRPIDQTIPYLILVGLLWTWVGMRFEAASTAANAVPSGMVYAVLMVSLAGYAFTCIFARFATALTVDRRGAGRFAMAVIVGMWLALPLVALILLQGVSDANSAAAVVLRSLGSFSPLFVMVDGINRPAAYGGGALSDLPGFIPAIVYVVATVLFLAVGEVLRFRRWRGFDYHYDMPKG